MLHATLHHASLPSSLYAYTTPTQTSYSIFFLNRTCFACLSACVTDHLLAKLFACSWILANLVGSSDRVASCRILARFARSLLSFRFFYFPLFSHRCIDTTRVQIREKRKFLLNEIARPKYRRYIIYYLFRTNRLLIYGSCEIN